MIFEFYPWKIDIDVEATRQLYLSNDYAEDKRINKKIYDGMSEKQKAFFLSLGVDIMKVRAEETVHADPGEGAGRTAVRRIDFLFCGRFLMLPEYQGRLYRDEEAFGENFPGTLKIVPMTEGERIPVFDIDGLPCIFKHPCSLSDGPEFEKWDCGHILGIIFKLQTCP